LLWVPWVQQVVEVRQFLVGSFSEHWAEGWWDGGTSAPACWCRKEELHVLRNTDDMHPHDTCIARQLPHCHPLGEILHTLPNSTHSVYVHITNTPTHMVG